jgi:hypothetical protein
MSALKTKKDSINELAVALLRRKDIEFEGGCRLEDDEGNCKEEHRGKINLVYCGDDSYRLNNGAATNPRFHLIGSVFVRKEDSRSTVTVSTYSGPVCLYLDQ